MTNANQAASGNTGSAASAPSVNGTLPGGQAVSAGDVVGKAQYDELYKKFGEQGRELGDLRGYKEFYESIQPLLVKLEQNPEVVTAIIDGKIDSNLARAVVENRISVTEAAAVSQAHATVKEKLGKEGYDAASPDQVASLVEKEAQKIRSEITEREEQRLFEETTQRFIANTPDFEKYAPEIDKWLDKHDITDISVAYYAVKGQMSEKEAKEAADQAAADRQKEAMLNASGGGITAQYTPDGTPVVDTLIGGKSNPNSIF